ncbi:MDR family MFS transporter [Dactylosporangium sp. NPDC051541]|uniref:MDR family MFS transporter n=1 Tax=Dactylosporangium sp. NPDC051541 TaxID=3363977 RepID=UPI0037A009B7
MTTTGISTPPVQRRRSALPGPFWALWSGTLVNRLGTMVLPFTGVYLTQARGFSVAVAGLAMTLFGVGSLLSQLIAGLLTDRIGRRATLCGSMLATAAVMLAVGYSTSLPAIIAAMFVLGLLIDAYRPASSALVADLVPPALRPRAFGLLFWAVNLGYAVAMVAGGWLAGLGFSWLFWADAVTCVVFAVLVWRAVPETRPAPGAPGAGPAGGFGAVLRDRTMVAFTCITLGQALVYLQTVTMLPVAMTDVAGLSPREFGLAMALNGLLIVAFQPFVAARLDRFDPPRVMALGLAVMALGFAATAYVTTMAGLALTVAVWTAGEIVTAGIGGAIVAALAPVRLRGRYNGIYGFAWALASAVAPLAGSRLLTAGVGTLWCTVGATGLLAAVGMLLLGPAVRRRTATTDRQ